MGLQAAGQDAVGFLWNYWHDLPYAESSWGRTALYGTAFIGLVHQPDEGGKWFHMLGRPDFISHNSHPWMQGWISTFSAPVEVDNEHWLYFSGMPLGHGFYLNPDWKKMSAGPSTRRIGVARWPKYRLFGIEATRDALHQHLQARLQITSTETDLATRTGAFRISLGAPISGTFIMFFFAQQDRLYLRQTEEPAALASAFSASLSS
jgi:hypothetical protein